MKIKIQSILASLLAVSLLTCSASAKTFPDVNNNSPYATAIQYVSEIGIMVGDNQGNFNPDKIVNRAEMATIVCRVLGQTENLSKSNVFTDVPMEHWANANIAKASALGIVGGYGGGKFGPGDPVTFEQAVTMIVRAIGEGDKATSYGGYPNGFIQVAQEKNLLNEIQAVQGQGLSRGAVAILLYNYYITQNNPGTSSNVGEHTHNYVTKTVPGSGHYEQVQVGTEQVLVRNEKRQYSKCVKCGHIAYTNEEMYGHYDPNSPYFSKDCWASTNLIYTEYVPIYEEKPVYENKWVEDTPATTVRVCSICGQQEP